jgi:hypothetical protein
VIGIFTSRAMRERGRYQIQFMKTRSSSGVGQKVDLDFNVDTLRISDLGEDEQEGNIQQNANKGNSIYAGLKRTSTVTANSVDASTGEILSDPTQGIAVPKVKAEIGGAKIRAMLAGLNSEKD